MSALKKAFLFVTYRPFSSPPARARVEEFKELARAGGLSCEGVFYQVLKKPHPGLFIGAGKIREIREEVQNHQVSLLVFESSLSGVQIRNLEKELGVMIRDRNQLILDIFAKRAHTYPGKLQVELARALDELPRMVGAWMSSLSRQGGGVGAKGPGEKAIETDRRQVKAQVKKIKKKLDKIRQVRKGHRSLRKKHKIPGLALMGYTNSGKSTLLNRLVHRETVESKNLPFMTLDPTTRKIHIPGGGEAVLTDTVGFVHNLSPHLIEAFKATLEESEAADILLHVIDLSSPLLKLQMETVHKLIQEFKWHHKPCIQVYNKTDKAPRERAFQTPSPVKGPRVFISALKNTGLDQLKTCIREEIEKLNMESVELYFPKNEEEKIYSLGKSGFIQKKETSSLGTLCYARLPACRLKEWQAFLIRKST